MQLQLLLCRFQHVLQHTKIATLNNFVQDILVQLEIGATPSAESRPLEPALEERKRVLAYACMILIYTCPRAACNERTERYRYRRKFVTRRRASPKQIRSAFRETLGANRRQHAAAAQSIAMMMPRERERKRAREERGRGAPALCKFSGASRGTGGGGSSSAPLSAAGN